MMGEDKMPIVEREEVEEGAGQVQDLERAASSPGPAQHDLETNHSTVYRPRDQSLANHSTVYRSRDLEKSVTISENMVAFKQDTTGVMVPESNRDNADSETYSVNSITTIDSQVNVQKLRSHTTIQTTCQHCGENVMTNVFHRKSYLTWCVSILLLPVCCCFIPHVFVKFQEPVHICPVCNQRVTEYSSRYTCCTK